MKKWTFTSTARVLLELEKECGCESLELNLQIRATVILCIVCPSLKMNFHKYGKNVTEIKKRNVGESSELKFTN